MRKAIHTGEGAPPKGPYSQAIVARGTLVFVSSQGPNAPGSGERIEGSFCEKAERVFENLSILLTAANSSWEQVVKIHVYLNDMSNFAAMNDVYLSYVQEPYPARTTTQSNIGEAEIFVDCVALTIDA